MLVGPLCSSRLRLRFHVFLFKIWRQNAVWNLHIPFNFQIFAFSNNWDLHLSLLENRHPHRIFRFRKVAFFFCAMIRLRSEPMINVKMSLLFDNINISYISFVFIFVYESLKRHSVYWELSRDRIIMLSRSKCRKLLSVSKA